MPCGARYTTPKLKAWALTTTTGRQYYNNYQAKYGGGCPSNRVTTNTTPKVVHPLPSLVRHFDQAHKNCGGNGILKFELGNVLRRAGLNGARAVDAGSAQAKAIEQAVSKNQFVDKRVAALATRIAKGDLPALKEALAAKPPLDRRMANQLDTAAKSGQGITKAELKNVLTEHANDGSSEGVLSTSEKQALLRSVTKGDFARPTTEALAKKIAAGQGVSLIGIRQL